MSTDPSVRIEHDLLGDREVPADAYYGVHTPVSYTHLTLPTTPYV